jgi:hypothetical protein
MAQRVRAKDDRSWQNEAELNAQQSASKTPATLPDLQRWIWKNY